MRGGRIRSGSRSWSSWPPAGAGAWAGAGWHGPRKVANPGPSADSPDGGLSGKMPGVTSSPRDADVLVSGAGPGGATTATFLAQGGLRVALVEREAFPRFKVGESLIPTCMDICKRLGVLDRVMGHGFQVKYGATFHDQELDLETTFDFQPGR